MPQISRYQSCLAILSHFEKLLITLIDEFDLQRRHCNKVRFRQEAFEKRAYIRGIQMKLWTEQNISIFLQNPKVVAQTDSVQRGPAPQAMQAEQRESVWLRPEHWYPKRSALFLALCLFFTDSTDFRVNLFSCIETLLGSLFAQSFKGHHSLGLANRTNRIFETSVRNIEHQGGRTSVIRDDHFSVSCQLIPKYLRRGSELSSRIKLHDTSFVLADNRIHDYLHLVYQNTGTCQLK